MSLFAAAKCFRGISMQIPAIALAIVSLSGLSACGKSAQAGSPVVAVVNDTHISLSQVKQVLDESGPDASPAATRHALQTIVDEELLAQQALKSDLQHDPAVEQSMQRAKRQILAHAYAEKVLFPKTPVTIAAQKSYYEKNPALFANRKTFQIVAYTVDRADLTESARQEFNRCRSPAEVRAVLEKHRIRYESEQLRRSSEQLPLEQLPAFAGAREGDVIIAHKNHDSEMLMALASIERSPITFDRARPVIEQYLINERNRTALASYLQGARSAANISYTQHDDQTQSAIREASAETTTDAGGGV
jgi:EpsD family peptidyl-prolyl cis-trans isomerase